MQQPTPDPLRQALSRPPETTPPPELDEWLAALAGGEIDALSPSEREQALAWVAGDPELGEVVLAAQRALDADEKAPLRLTPEPGSDTGGTPGIGPAGHPPRQSPLLFRMTAIGWALAACVTLGFGLLDATQTAGPPSGTGPLFDPGFQEQQRPALDQPTGSDQPTHYGTYAIVAGGVTVLLSVPLVVLAVRGRRRAQRR